MRTVILTAILVLLTGCAALATSVDPKYYTLREEELQAALAAQDEHTATQIYVERLDAALPAAVLKHSALFNRVTIRVEDYSFYSIHVYGTYQLGDEPRGVKAQIVEAVAGIVGNEMINSGAIRRVSDGRGGSRPVEFMVTVYAGRDAINGRSIGSFKFPEMRTITN
ncbi:MAG: hypothetical protein RBS39_14015 [Phycisphaerales bacterium]|jgi:hypothetical protein|nr:hypothetical protein [Phycisphaerales bacterium]